MCVHETSKGAGHKTSFCTCSAAAQYSCFTYPKLNTAVYLNWRDREGTGPGDLPRRISGMHLNISDAFLPRNFWWKALSSLIVPVTDLTILRLIPRKQTMATVRKLAME